MSDFHLDTNLWGADGRRGQTPSAGAVEFVLMEVCEVFGITQYRLGKILGVQSPGSVYRWFSGERTPASVFLIRLARLLLWESQGFPIGEIDAILWPDSLVKWKDGSITQEYHEPGGRGVVGDAYTTDVWQVAVSVSHSRQHMLDMDIRRGRLVVRDGR